VRPDNLRGGLAEVARVLRSLGRECTAPVFAVRELEPALETRARALWDTDALRAEYRELTTALATSERRLAALPAPAAMVESFLLGGRALRVLALDPLLPEPLVPSAERRTLVQAMERYDRAGRRVWAKHTPTHGGADRPSPVDLRSVRGDAQRLQRRSVG
jgi:phenylacetic acid degradation operon negative regulatory protein